MDASDQIRQVYGPYYRLLAPGVQDAETIVKQLLSGEVWGEPKSYGGEPMAKGYRGALPDGEEGFEFWAFQAPDNQYGHRAYWRKPGEFLLAANNLEVVKLKIAFVRITQSLHALAP